MKKTWLALICAAMCLALIAGCGGSSGGTASPSQEPAASRTPKPERTLPPVETQEPEPEETDEQDVSYFLDKWYVDGESILAYVEIKTDGTFELGSDMGDDEIITSEWLMEGENLILMAPEGESGNIVLTAIDEDSMSFAMDTGGSSGTFIRQSAYDPNAVVDTDDDIENERTPYALEDYLGSWVHDDDNTILEFDDDGRFYFWTEDFGEIIYSGDYEYNAEAYDIRFALEDDPDGYTIAWIIEGEYNRLLIMDLDGAYTRMEDN